MKKTVLSIVALLAVMVSFAQENSAVRIPSGYQGFLEQGPGLMFLDDMNSSVSFSTTHGFYFNENVFVGVGVSFDGGNGFFGMPLYTALKYNFSYSNKVTPTIQLRLGSYVGDNVGAYGDLAFGLRFGTSRDFAINVMAAASFFSKYTVETDRMWNSTNHLYEYVYKEYNPSSIGLRIGIEW